MWTLYPNWVFYLLFKKKTAAKLLQWTPKNQNTPDFVLLLSASKTQSLWPLVISKLCWFTLLFVDLWPKTPKLQTKPTKQTKIFTKNIEILEQLPCQITGRSLIRGFWFILQLLFTTGLLFIVNYVESAVALWWLIARHHWTTRFSQFWITTSWKFRFWEKSY